MPDELSDLFGSRWFWITTSVLAAACLGLAVAYYLRHPERNLFEDFQARVPFGTPATNGHVPGEAAPASTEAGLGEA